jgi:hypothetical protein
VQPAANRRRRSCRVTPSREEETSGSELRHARQPEDGYAAVWTFREHISYTIWVKTTGNDPPFMKYSLLEQAGPINVSVCIYAGLHGKLPLHILIYIKYSGFLSIELFFWCDFTFQTRLSSD